MDLGDKLCGYLYSYWETNENLLLGDQHNQIYILERDTWLHCEKLILGGWRECAGMWAG